MTLHEQFPLIPEGVTYDEHRIESVQYTSDHDPDTHILFSNGVTLKMWFSRDPDHRGEIYACHSPAWRRQRSRYLTTPEDVIAEIIRVGSLPLN